MPIPDFDHNNVLPPHLGNPTEMQEVSPYFATTLEFVERFATSPVRIEILEKYLLFRNKLNECGVIYGFQWVDGSFSENIEVSEKRHPNDIDLVTFFWGHDMTYLNHINSEIPEFFNPLEAKRVYKLDHYPVDYNQNNYSTADGILEVTRYWVQLFSHNRNRVWKGMIRIELNTPELDNKALDYLNQIKGNAIK